MPVFLLFMIVFFFSSMSAAQNGTAGYGQDNISDMEKIVMEGNARLLSLMLPEIKSITESETILLSGKLDNITEKMDAFERRRLSVKSGAKAAFDKAQNLADMGNMKEAGFYYAVACASDPDEGLYLYGYVNAVLNWAERNIKSNRPEAALRALSDMEGFLYSGASVTPSNAESAAGLLKRVSSKIDEAQKASFSKNYNTGTDTLKAALAEAASILAYPIPSGLDNVTAYQTGLQAAAARLMKFSADSGGGEIPAMLKNLSVRINEAARMEEAERILRKGLELLDSADALPKGTAPYSAAAGELSLIYQRLSLLSLGASPDLKKRTGVFAGRFEKLARDISKFSGESAVSRMKNRYGAVVKRLVKNETKAEKALAALYALQDEIVAESSKITDTESLREARGIVTAINGDIETWRDIQSSRYERWAVKTIKKFNDLYKDEMGMLGSGRDTKNRIYLGLKDYLCPIDLKYLGVPGLRAYTEVFDFFYKELDREQRLDLSAEFVSCEKKSLSEF